METEPRKPELEPASRRQESEGNCRRGCDCTTSEARAAWRPPAPYRSRQNGQNPGSSAGMNGLMTVAGTSKYVTYTVTTSVPSFLALWTWP